MNAGRFVGHRVASRPFDAGRRRIDWRGTWRCIRVELFAGAGVGAVAGVCVACNGLFRVDVRSAGAGIGGNAGLLSTGCANSSGT
jgi:hypothetical protein